MSSDLEPKPELPLLKSKLVIPLLPPEFVHRPRLTERINRGVKGPLTLISAPAGFGKTQLLAEWAAQDDLLRSRVAWLTLDPEDNDLTRFFRYLICAFQALDPRFGEETLDFVQSTTSSGLEMKLTLLSNEFAALPADTVLILDEFHVLEESVILESLGFLLKHLSPCLHIVLASRRKPALDIALLRAKGQVTELGAEMLRFTDDEALQFFHQTLGRELLPETIAALQERTEGWITALQLAAIALRGQSDPFVLPADFAGDARYLVDFLSKEVLSRQPEQVHQFLLKSAVLDILSGPLCEAVVDPTARPGYGAAMLARLEHANLFLSPLDPQHEWFRYHRLFADFLRYMQAETREEEIPVLHRRAAAWFEMHGHHDEAFKHALASQDMEWAAGLMERNVETMIKAGDLEILTHWIGKLPDEVIHRHIHLGLAYVWGTIAAYQLDRAWYWLHDIQQSVESIEEQSGEAVDGGIWEDDALRHIHGGLAMCRSMLALMSGDVRQAAEYSRKAVACLEEEENPFVHSLLYLEDSLYQVLSGDTAKAIETLRKTARTARQSNNLLVLVVAICQLAETQAMQGCLSHALATLEKAQFVALGSDENPLAGIVDIEVGEILRERGLLEKAKEHLERGIRLTKSWWSLSSLDGMGSLACLLQSQGNLAGAQELIAETYRLALSTESSQWDDVFVSALATRMALQRHDLATAIRWWRKAGMLKDVGDIGLEHYPYHILEYIQLTQARLYLVLGQDTGKVRYLQQALALLNPLLPQAERFQRVTSKIELLVLRALVEQTMGENDRAAQTLLSALALGEPEGYRRVFLDEGQPMATLLVCCRQIQRGSEIYLPSPEYVEGLLESIQQAADIALASPSSDDRQVDPTTITTKEGWPITLSAREVEVLLLIAKGKSNQEIADQLYLALNTVKRHAYNIYAKLDVHKRTHAVAKARQLELLP